MNFLLPGVKLVELDFPVQIDRNLRPHRRTRLRWRGPHDIEAVRYRRVRLERLPSHAI
jgi:hypothetical protein